MERWPRQRSLVVDVVGESRWREQQGSPWCGGCSSALIDSGRRGVGGASGKSELACTEEVKLAFEVYEEERKDSKAA